MSWFSKLGSSINAGIQTAAKWIGNLGATVMDPITHNSENLQMQKDELEYQHNLQNTIFEREDNAQQRAANDLASAGLSKTLAAGSGAGAGSVVSTKAPQRESDVGSLLTMAQISQQMANVSHTKAETKRLSLQNTLDQMNIDYFNELGIAPAEQNKYTQLGEALVTGFNQLGGLWSGEKNGASSVIDALKDGSSWLAGKAADVANAAAAPVVQAADRVTKYIDSRVKNGIENNKIEWNIPDQPKGNPNDILEEAPAYLKDYQSYVAWMKLKGFGDQIKSYEKWAEVTGH